MAETVKIHLVRHGHPDAGFGTAYDPGLDAAGRAQAEAMAQTLGPLGPLALVTSPLRRTRETAHALETTWQTQARVEERVSEIPSPTRDLQKRGQWVREILRQRWSALPDYHAWRDSMLAALLELPASTVITTHFVAINVAVGAATGDDRVTCFEPDYCSCTTLTVGNNALRLITLGAQRKTIIF
jgi:broad specificity phosphatase PhoE